MPDFTLTPDFAIEEEVKTKTLISEAENGVEQRRGKWAGPLRKWNLTYRNRLAADYQAVRDFFINKMGPLVSFTWVNPNDSAQYNVRFVDDSLKITRHDGPIYDFEFSIIQVK